MPRSWRASWVHSSATRAVIATSRSARARSPAVTSSAVACIAAVLARWPASVTRSRCRESRTTSRRAASRRSTVRTCSGSAWRTAAVRTAGTPAASARARRCAACERHPGVPSGPPWWTTSTARPSRGSRTCHAARRWRARSRRPASTARPTSESGPRRTSRRLPPCSPSPTPCDILAVSPTAALREPCARRTESGVGVESGVVGVGWDHRASRSGVVTGMPRSPRRWVSVTRRHSAAQPTPGMLPPPRPRASTVTRGRRGSTIAPPRTGVRGRGGGADAVPLPAPPASTSLPARRASAPLPAPPASAPGRVRMASAPFRVRTAPASGPVAPAASGSTARSTPRTGAIPARPHAVANRTAP